MIDFGAATPDRPKSVLKSETKADRPKACQTSILSMAKGHASEMPVNDGLTDGHHPPNWCADLKRRYLLFLCGSK